MSTQTQLASIEPSPSGGTRRACRESHPSLYGGPLLRFCPGLAEEPGEVAAEDLADTRLGVPAVEQVAGDELETLRRVQVRHEGVDVLGLPRRRDAQPA